MVSRTIQASWEISSGLRGEMGSHKHKGAVLQGHLRVLWGRRKPAEKSDLHPQSWGNLGTGKTGSETSVWVHVYTCTNSLKICGH